MVVKTIFVIKHSFGSFEVDSISPVSETANDIRSNRIALANLVGAVTLCLPLPAGRLKGCQLQEVEHPLLMKAV